MTRSHFVVTVVVVVTIICQGLRDIVHQIQDSRFHGTGLGVVGNGLTKKSRHLAGQVLKAIPKTKGRFPTRRLGNEKIIEMLAVGLLVHPIKDKKIYNNDGPIQQDSRV